MRKTLFFTVFAVILSCWPAAAQNAGNPTNELNALVAKIKVDIQSGKTTEAALSDDIKQFDVLLAEHKGEKTDIIANILYMKAALYAEVIGDTNKAEALMTQLKTEYADTAFVTNIVNRLAQEAEEDKIQATLVTGTAFPNFTEKDVMGQPLSPAQYKGKVVLVDFWATWCVPCRIELPNLIAAYQKYHGQGFEVIGVSLDQDQQALLTFIKQNNMPWPEYFDGQSRNNKLAMQYGIEAIPMNFLLDKDGKIIGKNLRGDDLANAIATALAK